MSNPSFNLRAAIERNYSRLQAEENPRELRKQAKKLREEAAAKITRAEALERRAEEIAKNAKTEGA